MLVSWLIFSRPMYTYFLWNSLPSVLFLMHDWSTSLLVKYNKSHSSAWLLLFKIYKAEITSQMPSLFNFHGTFWKAVHGRHHIAHTWPHLTHTELSHAVLQTFTLLSGAKCTTMANLDTLRWSWPDFKHSLPTAVHVGEESCPIKQQRLPLTSRTPPSASDRAVKDCYPHVVKTITCFHPQAHLYTPIATCNIQF